MTKKTKIALGFLLIEICLVFLLTKSCESNIVQQRKTTCNEFGKMNQVEFKYSEDTGICWVKEANKFVKYDY